MAELVEKNHGETVYTLKFTERELARLVAGYGAASAVDTNRLLMEWGLKSSGWSDFDPTYKFLKQNVLGVRY